MSSRLKQAVSNWKSYNICFSKAALFISGLVFSHAFVEYAFFSVLMSFITSSWERYNLPKAAAIVNAQEGVAILVAVIVAYFADVQLGRFKVVGYTTAAFITGLLLLRFHTSSSGIFYLALLLVTLGKGGRSPTLKAFLCDQFDPNQNSEMAEARKQFWWRTAWFLGALMATIISSSQPMKKTMMISSIITGGASLFFFLGISFYSKEPPRSNITSQMNNWRCLLKLVPLWITFLIYCLVKAAGTTFFIEQSDNLEDQIGNGFRIPLTFFFVLNSFTCFITSYFVDFLTSKLWKENQERQRARIVRIAIGIFVSFLCCITAWQVEVRRLKLIKEFGISDSQDQLHVPMNILWLTPQFFLLGFMAGLVEEGIPDSFHNLVPESMKFYELPFDQCVMGIGKFLSVLTIFVFRGWFGDTSGTSHLDRYFLMLAMISIGSLAFFTIAAYACYWKIAPQEDVQNSIMEEGLVQGTTSSSAPLGNESSQMMADVNESPADPLFQQFMTPINSDNEVATSVELEIILHPQSTSEQLTLTEASSTQSLVTRTTSLPYFVLQGDSLATSTRNTVRKSLRNRSFSSTSGGNSRPSNN